jgi:hypothetical protein
MVQLGLTTSKFVAVIIIAILAASAISIGVSTMLIAGSPGPEGPQGETGLQGPQGSKGETGPAGATGPSGPIGATGATGAQGLQGEQGPYPPDFDSDWIDITNKAGQYLTLTHGLNSADVIIDITGKTTADGGAHQWHLGLTGYTSGFSQTYGGANSDYGYSVVATSDGGYAVAGYTYSYGAGNSDFWLVKTDASGTAIWNQTYGGTGSEWGSSLIQTSDGGYAVAGSTLSFGAGSSDVWLVKTDSIGNMQWNQTYGGTDFDYGYSVVQTSDGGYAIAGFTESYGFGLDDFWLIKTASDGDAQWNQTYGGADSEQGYSLVQTIDGGYVIAGTTSSYGAGNSDFWLVKTDASGTAIWNQTYGGTDSDEAQSVVEVNDGGYAVAGSTLSFGAGSSDVWLVKTAIESGLAWTDSTANTITLYRGLTDPYWNYVRVRVWKIE